MAKLIIWDFNWADELDITGFKVFTDDEYSKALTHTLNAFKERIEDEGEDAWPIGYGVGSNQEITIEDEEDYMSLFTTTTISNEEYEYFMKYFDGEQGSSPFPYEY